jgi:hypothetical protein
MSLYRLEFVAMSDGGKIQIARRTKDDRPREPIVREEERRDDGLDNAGQTIMGLLEEAADMTSPGEQLSRPAATALVNRWRRGGRPPRTGL